MSAADAAPDGPACDPAKERPLVQVALDFVDLPRAIEVAREAVAGGADWIEAGTPLIKAEGLGAVRALKAEFPDKTIVADMKTMDAGRTEVECAAKAGAGVVGVLGAASDSTIRECVEAARNYGCKLIVDMIEVADPVARAKRAQELGADYIGIHTAIDQQMRGEAPFETLRAVAETVVIPVSVAGGINSETAAAAVDAGAGIVVVGGAIIKAVDAAAATAEIRRAVDERVCIETTLFKRAGEADIRTILEQVSTANVSDAWHRQPSLPGIRPLLPGAHMCGPAVTVRTYAGDWAKPVEAIDACKPGDVLVVDACDATPAMWGELATHSAVVKGLAGLVVWGAIRDTPEIARLGFPAFSSKVCANAGEPKGFGEIGVPIVIAGQTVKPGDWIVGDDDGVMVLPKEQAVELANRAMDVLEKENRLRGEIDGGKTLAEVAYLQKWEKAR
jgi:3-hexulose-6-phosphate synthase / 6-phospho-3-hexuloisomerase